MATVEIYQYPKYGFIQIKINDKVFDKLYFEFLSPALAPNITYNFVETLLNDPSNERRYDPTRPTHVHTQADSNCKGLGLRFVQTTPRTVFGATFHPKREIHPDLRHDRGVLSMNSHGSTVNGDFTLFYHHRPMLDVLSYPFAKVAPSSEGVLQALQDAGIDTEEVIEDVVMIVATGVTNEIPEVQQETAIPTPPVEDMVADHELAAKQD